jgi:hypothetical protein
MGGPIFHANVLKPSDLVNERPLVSLEKAHKESDRLTLNLVFECDLGPRHWADGQSGFSNPEKVRV